MKLIVSLSQLPTGQMYTSNGFHCYGTSISKEKGDMTNFSKWNNSSINLELVLLAETGSVARAVKLSHLTNTGFT